MYHYFQGINSQERGCSSTAEEAGLDKPSVLIAATLKASVAENGAKIELGVIANV